MFLFVSELISQWMQVNFFMDYQRDDALIHNKRNVCMKIIQIMYVLMSGKGNCLWVDYKYQELFLGLYNNQIQHFSMPKSSSYQKHTQETKNSLIQLVIENKLSIFKASQITSIPLSTAKLIVKRFRESRKIIKSNVQQQVLQTKEKELSSQNKSHSQLSPSLEINRSANQSQITPNQVSVMYFLTPEPLIMLYYPQTFIYGWDMQWS